MGTLNTLATAWNQNIEINDRKRFSSDIRYQELPRIDDKWTRYRLRR